MMNADMRAGTPHIAIMTMTIIDCITIYCVYMYDSCLYDIDSNIAGYGNGNSAVAIATV